MKKAILILSDTRDLSTYPAVYNVAREMKKRDVWVKIITGAPCEEKKLKIFFDEYELIGEKKGLLKSMYEYSKSLLKSGKVDFVFCFEPRDAMNIAIISLLKESCYVYYNLEIFEETIAITNHSPVKKLKFLILKSLEKIFNSKCKYFVIQDEIREKISARYGIKNKNTRYIPNSYITNIENLKNAIPARKNGILFSGGLERWSIEPIIENISKFNNMGLVLSGWSRDGYLEENREILLKNGVEINDKILNGEELISFVKKQSIGLVFYKADSENVYNIGRSSGKFFLYLSCGIPVIVQRLPGIAEDTEKYGIGIVIDNIEDIPEAIEKIKNNYDKYKTNVQKIYFEKYDYSNISKCFYDEIILERGR